MTQRRHSYKSLFFDLDDTLWDTAHNNKVCLEEIYYAYHFGRYYPSFDDFFDKYMPHNLMLWEQYRNHVIDRRTLILERFLYVLRPMGIDDEAFIIKLNNDFLLRTATKTKLVDGAIALLDYLFNRYRLFILSNGFREIQFLKMQNAGLAPYFERLFLSEDVSIQKPHPKIFDYALKSANARRFESLMIGDSYEADIVGAQNARIDQLWLNPSHKSPPGHPPTFTVFSLAEIKEIL